MMGGAFDDEEGRLCLRASITKADYGNWFSSRRDRLVYEVDEVLEWWWNHLQEHPTNRGRSV
jgi:hypothetical protein